MVTVLVFMTVCFVGLVAGGLLAGPRGSFIGGCSGIIICLMAMTPGAFLLGVLLLVAAGLIISGHYDNMIKAAMKAKRELEEERHQKRNELINLHKQIVPEIRFRWADWKHSVERGDDLKDRNHCRGRYMKVITNIQSILGYLQDTDDNIRHWELVHEMCLGMKDGYPHAREFWEDKSIQQWLPKNPLEKNNDDES